MNITLLLDMVSDAFPERMAYGDAAHGLSFGAMAQRCRGAAAWIASLAEVQRIAYVGLNSALLPQALFASAYAGKPFVPINYRLTDEALRQLLARTAPSIAIVDEAMADRATGIDGVRVLKHGEFAALASEAAQTEPPAVADESGIAVLLFTSGTTGEPKAAVLRHHQLSSYVISSVEFAGADEQEAALVSVPPYHVAGISAILTGLYAARRTVYIDAFTPEEWLATVEHQRITQAMVVPTMLDRILDVIESRGLSLHHFRALSYGGGRMPATVIERALRLLPDVDFVNAYGLTETSSTIAVLGPEDHREAIGSDDPAVRRRLGSVGRPLPTLELEIRGPDGQRLPAGQSGEVYVRGDQVAGEYLHRKVLDSEGWFATNDGGWLDEAGYLYIEGRLDDVIVRGGENISPGEIEEVLREHPGVADVAVLGLPDEQWGETVAAVIVPVGEAPSIEELAALVKGRLRSTRTPEYWEFRTELPYNETGKLLRRVLRSELSHRS